MSEIAIRPLRADDRLGWDPLWRAYLNFYRAELSAEVTEHTWSSLCDSAGPVHGLVAVVDDRPIGLAHVVLHATTRATGPTCYLEDLFVGRTERGTGVGRRLIEAVYAFADEHGAASVYWITQEYNAPARSLYDTVARRNSFVMYER